MTLQEIDQTFVGRDTEPKDVEIAKQDGSFIFSNRGKKYLDFTMGWCVGNFGWNNLEIKSRIQRFRGPDYVSPHQMYKPWTELAQKLAAVAPGQLVKSFRATGGTEAVEIALQAAMNYTQKTKFVSLEDGYHGDSIVARSIGSPDFGPWYKNPFNDFRIKPPLDGDSAEQVEKRLKKGDVAAVIMEPFVCNRGVMTPTQEFMTRLSEACRANDVLLIIDEVATGFMRTGKMFGSEHFDLKPDILTLGKAITGGFAPMGATLMTEEVATAMNYENSYYSTYGWHPLSVEAALATLQYIEDKKGYLEENIAETSNYIVDRIQSIDFKKPPKLSWKGLAIGVSFDSEDYGSKIVEKAEEEGLLISEGESGFTLFPALTIDKQTVDEGLDIIEKCARAS